MTLLWSICCVLLGGAGGACLMHLLGGGVCALGRGRTGRFDLPEPPRGRGNRRVAYRGRRLAASGAPDFRLSASGPSAEHMAEEKRQHQQQEAFTRGLHNVLSFEPSPTQRDIR